MTCLETKTDEPHVSNVAFVLSRVREKLVTCLGTKTDACPEAPYVLKRLGLDLGTLSAGLKLLCSDQEGQ